MVNPEDPLKSRRARDMNMVLDERGLTDGYILNIVGVSQAFADCGETNRIISPRIS